jgi:hypothetical protein
MLRGIKGTRGYVGVAWFKPGICKVRGSGGDVEKVKVHCVKDRAVPYTYRYNAQKLQTGD